MEHLIAQLSHVEVPESTKTSIIAIDDRYNLSNEASGEAQLDFHSFQLDDFLHQKGSIIDGKVVVDANQISRLFHAVETEWVIVDFGMHDILTATDFIHKLATYFFLAPAPANRQLVFLVQGVLLPIFLRAANSAFNQLPESNMVIAKSAQVEMLFLSVIAEKTIDRLAFITWLTVQMKRLVPFITRRAINHNKG